jgi:chemotaxis protein methyltransferase CheR
MDKKKEHTMDRPMGNEGFIPLNKISMSEECFARFSNFIQGNYGIKMPEIKRTMLESRLQKRLRKLGMACFDEYGDYVFSSEGLANELVHMIDSVTTNKTDFFREPAHFDYLVDHALPELIRTTGAGVRNPLKIWSAGCSSGEEPYTLAMVLNEYAATVQGFDYSILGTDLSVQVLEKAVKGIYKESLVEPVPEQLKKRYILRSKSREKALVRVVPELRSKVKYRRLNLMDDELNVDGGMDMVFCRNVIIYFERPVQEALIHKLCGKLVEGGYLFLGHSETLHGMNLPLKQAAPMVYRKVSK